MRVAIIGSGNVGKALAGSLVKAGHEVTLSAKHPEHARAAAEETGARAVDGSAEAAAAAEVVILAVPTPALDDVAAELRSITGKAVVDPSNRVDPQNPGSVLDGTSNAEQLQSLLPSASVVKAFNTLFASRMADPIADGQPVDAYVAGDDEDAKRKVLDLAASIGLRPVDCGPLALARVLEGMALTNILLQIRNNWPWQSAFRLVGPTPGLASPTAEAVDRVMRQSG